MAQIEYGLDSVSNFRLLNFATGSYTCKCIVCGKEFMGDKRAVQCLDCACKMVEEKLISTNKQSTPCSCCECGKPVKEPLCDDCMRSAIGAIPALIDKYLSIQPDEPEYEAHLRAFGIWVRSESTFVKTADR